MREESNDELIALYYRIRDIHNSLIDSARKRTFYDGRGEGTEIAPLVAGTDGCAVRDHFELHRQAALIEHDPSRSFKRALRGILKRSRENGRPINYVLACCALSKAYRIRYFELIPSLELLQTAQPHLDKLRENVSRTDVHARFLKEMTWRINQETALTCIYLRRFDEAMRHIEENRRSTDGDPSWNKEHTLNNVCEAFIRFMQAWQNGQGCEDAYAYLIETARPLTSPGRRGLADHLRLYAAFSLVFSRVEPLLQQAYEVLRPLTESGYPLAAIYARLGCAACCLWRGDRSNFDRWFDEYRNASRSTSHNGNNRALSWEIRNKTRAAPFFFLLEKELELSVSEPEQLDTLIAQVRNRCASAQRDLERLRDLRWRLAYAPQVYDFYRLLVRAFLVKARKNNGLTKDELILLTAFVEKSRKAALVARHTGHATTLLEHEAQISEAILDDFEQPNEKPVGKLVDISSRDTTAAFLFTGESRVPLAVLWRRGKGALYEGRTVTEAVRRAAEALAAHPPQRIYLFDHPASYTAEEGLRSVLYNKLSPAPLIMHAEDMHRFVRDSQARPAGARTAGVFCCRYPARAEQMHNEARGAAHRFAPWCERNHIALRKYDLTGCASPQEFFAMLSEVDIALVFVHGELTAEELQQSLRFTGFSVHLTDLYVHRAAFAHKRILLCACRSGANAVSGNHEVVSIGTLMAALGADLVYCPPGRPRIAEFAQRAGEFAEILDGKGVAYSDGWRVIV